MYLFGRGLRSAGALCGRRSLDLEAAQGIDRLHGPLDGRWGEIPGIAQLQSLGLPHKRQGSGAAVAGVRGCGAVGAWKRQFYHKSESLNPPSPPPPLCDIPSRCCFFAGPWTVTRSSLRMLRRVAAFCRPLRPVLLLVSFPRSQSPVVGVLGLCWLWHGVPFTRQRCPVVGVLWLCWLLPGSFDCFCCPHTSVHRPSIACLAVFLCARCPGALLLRVLS